MAKNNVFENENMTVVFEVCAVDAIELDGLDNLPILGIMDSVMYIQYMNNDGTDFAIKRFGIPKNVLNGTQYATLFCGYWYQSTLQGLKRKQNSLVNKKDKTTKDRLTLEAIKLPIRFTESVISVLGFEQEEDYYPRAIRTTVWSVNSGAWMSADGGTRYWPLGGKGLEADIKQYATGKMTKAKFKEQYCAYCAQWLKTSENGDDTTFGELFRNFSPKATDLMLSDLVNCYKGVKLQYQEDISHKGMRGQALVAQAVLQMLKTVYKFKEVSKKTVVDKEI